MKKYIIFFIIFSCSYICKSQTRYILYVDTNFRINVSETSLPEIAITGNYNDLLNKPSFLPNILNKSVNYTIVDTCFHINKQPILHLWVNCTNGDLTITLPDYSSFIGYTIIIGKSDNTINTLTISGLLLNNTIILKNTYKNIIATPTGWFQN